MKWCGLGLAVLALAWLFLAWRVWRLERRWLRSIGQKRKLVLLVGGASDERSNPN